MSLALQPSGSWVRIDILPGSPDVVRLSSTRPWPDPADYYGGQKIGEVLRWGDAVRALSDTSGAPVVGRFSFEIRDFSGYWRDLLASRTYLTTQDVTYYLASEHAHWLAVLDDPRLGFRGQIVRAAPRPNRVFLVDAESRIGTRYGPFNLDSPCLTRAYTTTDFPGLRRESENTAVPFLWGELSDEGMESAVPGPDLAPYQVSRGMVVPTYCGPLGAGPTYASPPCNLRVTITDGGGPRIATTIGVTALTANGQTTATVITEANYPRYPSGSDRALIEWDDCNGSPSPVIAFRVFLGDAPALPTHGLDTMNNGGTFVNPEQVYNHNGIPPGDDDRYKNRLPPPPLVNTAVIGNEGEFFCLLGHPGRITRIYASDLQETAAYAPVETGEIGAGNYFDLGPNDDGYLTTINGRDYFGFLARGPKADAHKDGTFPFRVNLCGWHDDASPALLIDRAAYVYQDVFTQLQGGATGEGFQSGARLLIPSFRSAPAIPILQSTTFAAVQDLTALEMGGEGCRATVYLDTFETTWRSFQTDMNRTFFWDTGDNHHGQLMLAMMAQDIDPEDGLIFREFIDIRRVENAGEPEPERIENVLRYQFDRTPEGTYRSGVLERRDAVSIAGYGGEFSSGTVIDLPYTRDPATAAYTMGRYLADRATAPAYPSVITRLKKGVIVELGEQFRVQHPDLGTETAVIYCRESSASVTRGEVVLRGRLRYRFADTYAVAASPDDTTGTAWDDAPEDERAIYAFATDDAGQESESRAV